MPLSLLRVSYITQREQLHKCTALELKYSKYRSWPFLPKPAQTQLKSEKRSQLPLWEGTKTRLIGNAQGTSQAPAARGCQLRACARSPRLPQPSCWAWAQLWPSPALGSPAAAGSVLSLGRNRSWCKWVKPCWNLGEKSLMLKLQSLFLSHKYWFLSCPLWSTHTIKSADFSTY